VLARALPPVRLADATTVPAAVHVQLDHRVLILTIAAILLATLLTTAAPVFDALRLDVQTLLRTTRAPRTGTLRYVAVAVQIALCTVLLGSMVLSVRSLLNLRKLDPGFDSGHVVTFALDPSSASYTTEQARAIESRLLEETTSLPGIHSASVSMLGLMKGTGLKATITHVGVKASDADYLNTSLHAVSSEYFDTLGIRLLAGRTFTQDDINRTPRPRIVNEQFVRQFFPAANPIGRLFGVGGDYQVIGVVSDAHYRSLREPVPPIMYAPFDRRDWTGTSILHVRTGGNPQSLIAPITRILRRLDPRLSFHEVRTLSEEIELSLWKERMTAKLSVVFSTLAGLTTSVGLFALLAYVVVQRTREIGIRVALGANKRHLLIWITRLALPITFCGFVSGIVSLLITTRWMTPLLFEVSARDPRLVIFIGVAIFLIGALAALVPTVRALRLQPSVALRHEAQ
jgi:predicted permease